VRHRTQRPGGMLLTVDLLDRSDPAYLPLNALALLSRGMDRIRGVKRQSADLRRAYGGHGARDRYLRPRKARDRFARLLPGARVTHYLRWRYSVAWRKPGRGQPA
jgi:hypothetical protein